MFLSETLLGMRNSTGTAVAAAGGFIDPNGLINVSETASTTWGAGLATDTLGIKGTGQNFGLVAAAEVDGSSPLVALRSFVRLPWTLTAQSAGAGTRGRAKLSLLINNVVVLTANGATRNLNDANGTKYVDIFDVAMSAAQAVRLTPGSVIAFLFEVEVTTASGVPGSTFTPTLRHDPQALDDQLVVEFQGMAGVL